MGRIHSEVEKVFAFGEAGVVILLLRDERISGKLMDAGNDVADDGGGDEEGEGTVEGFLCVDPGEVRRKKYVVSGNRTEQSNQHTRTDAAEIEGDDDGGIEGDELRTGGNRSQGQTGGKSQKKIIMARVYRRGADKFL